MARRRRAERRQVIPDAKYGSITVAKFINQVMRRGKKNTAEQLVYGALEMIGEKTGEEPLELFEKALGNVKPHLEVKSRRVGGATYQVPMEVSGDRQLSLAFRWIIQFAKGRKGSSMKQALAQELIDAAGNNGAAIKKRDDTHKMAQANKAFAHYRW